MAHPRTLLTRGTGLPWGLSKELLGSSFKRAPKAVLGGHWPWGVCWGNMLSYAGYSEDTKNRAHTRTKPYTNMPCTTKSTKTLVARTHATTTMYYDVLRRTTTYCDVLGRTTKYYEVLRGTKRYYDVFRGTTRYYEVLRGTTTYYGVL